MWNSLSRILAPRAKVIAFDDAGDREHLDEKVAGPFRISPLATSADPGAWELSALLDAVTEAMRDPARFFEVPPQQELASWTPSVLSFASRASSTGQDYVHVDITGHVDGKSAVILVPHWNADDEAYRSLVRLLAIFGFTVFLVTLPFHRSRGAGPIANDFLNADLGATINSVRQAVIDVRTLTQEIKSRGFKTVSYLGISLGSCIAALAAAFEPGLERIALLLTAGSFAETVWTGTATRHIRKSLEGHVTLAELEQAWQIISPSSFMSEIAARNLPTLVVLGEYDRVVPYRLGEEFAEAISSVLESVHITRFKCGHYSLAMLPFSVLAFRLVTRFLTKPPNHHSAQRTEALGRVGS